MASAWIDSVEADAAEAATLASRLVEDARRPLVTIGATDALGARAAIGFARSVGAIVECPAARAIEPFVTTLSDAGMMLGAPAEMRRRADRFVALGPDALADAEFSRFLLEGVPDLGRSTRGRRRKLLWISGPEVLPPFPVDLDVERFDCAADAVGDVVACLRAHRAKRPFDEAVVSAGHADFMVEWLEAAGFGCAIFAASAFDSIDLELLCGLIAELNETTRFTGLPMMPDTNAWAVQQVAVAMTGFALPVSFARGRPEADPAGLFGREADLAIHVDDGVADKQEAAVEGEPPRIVLTTDDRAAQWRAHARIVFAVAAAGRERASVDIEPRAGQFVARMATAPDADRATVSDVLGSLGARVAAEEAEVAA